MSHGGKGDTPRPFSVDQKTFESNWNAIFGKNKEEEKQEVPEGDVKDSTQGG